MTTVRAFVGLDYHEDSVQVCVLDATGRMLLNRACANDAGEIRRLVGRIGVVRVEAAVEACCGSANLADELSRAPGWSIPLAHPGYVARIKQSPDKTDYSDARLLADLTRVGYLPKVWLAPEPIRELRRLVRYRQQLVDERRNIKLRIRALLRDARVRCETAHPWTQGWRNWLEHEAALSEEVRWIMQQHLRRLDALSQDIRQVQQRLQMRVADDAVVQALLTQKGVGLVTAVTLRAEIGRFDRFRSGKQLARFCGLSPRNVSSGQRMADAGLIKAGQPQLRATLIQTAQVLMRFDARWSQWAVQLRRRGKPGSVVAAATANRWIRWLYHQMHSCEGSQTAA